MSSSSLSNSNNSASTGQLSPEQVYLAPATAASATGEEGNQKSPSKHHIRLREFLPPPPPPPPFLQRFKQSSSSTTSATSPNGSEQAPLAPQMQTQTSLSPTSPPISTTTSTAAKSPKEGHKGFSLKQIKSDIKSMFKHSPGSACGTNNNGAANWPLGPHPKAHRLSGDASPHIITEEIQTNRNSSLNNELGHSGSSDASLSTRVGGGASSNYPNAPHTIGTASGARLIQDMINDQQMQQQQRQMLNGEFDPLLSSSPGASQVKRSSFIEADPLRRNNNNNQYNPLMGSTPSLVLSAAQCQHIMTALSSNNSSIPNSYNNINTATANSSSAVGNFNPRAAAINLKIISSNQPAYYHIDRETLADVQKKLALLSPQERVALQKLSYQLLLEQYELKRSQIVSLEEDIKELNRILCARNQTIRSQFEIDNLRNEIRNLTNEKAELEIKISQKTGWTCSRCTYINKNEDVVCVMCNIERDVTEIYICKNCNTKNSITNMKCTKCSAHLGAENQIEAQQLAASGGNPATNNNHQLNSQMSTTSTGSSGGSPHPYHHQQQYYQNQQSSPTTNNHGLGGNRSRNASATSLNGVGGSNQALVDALAAASLANSGAGGNGSGKISHRPPPPIPPPYSPSVGQRSTSAHPVASAPNLGLPSIPYVPGIGVVHHSSSTTSAGSNSPLSPPIASPNNNSPILSGNRTPLVYNTSNSTASPTFNNNNNNGRPRYL